MGGGVQNREKLAGYQKGVGVSSRWEGGVFVDGQASTRDGRRRREGMAK